MVNAAAAALLTLRPLAASADVTAATPVVPVVKTKGIERWMFGDTAADYQTEAFLIDVAAAPIEDALELIQTGQPNQTYHLPYGVELCMRSETFVLRAEGRARAWLQRFARSQNRTGRGAALLWSRLS